MLIPIVIIILLYVVFSKKMNNEPIKLKTNIFVSSIILVLSITLYTLTILVPGLQNKYQTISNKKLFLTASNPSLTTEQYGTLGFCFLDLKAMMFPVSLEENYVTNNNENESSVTTEYSREIDDTKWKEIIENEKNIKMNSKILINFLFSLYLFCNTS